MSGIVANLIEAATRRLLNAGSSSARLDAQLLLGLATGWSRTAVLAHPEWVVSADEGGMFASLVERRAAAEPIAYLLGEREFYGRAFKVDRRALIPRPETELLVDLGITAVRRFRALGLQPRVVDVGTGCGAIAISLAAEVNVGVIATDVSADALALAAENAERLGVSKLITFAQADLLAGVSGPLHVVVANLPYIPSSADLPPEVKDYEPNVALFGGQRGTELIERFLREAKPLLAPHAEVCLELDERDQAEGVSAAAAALYPHTAVSVCQDGGGYDRVVRVLT